MSTDYPPISLRRRLLLLLLLLGGCGLAAPGALSRSTPAQSQAPTAPPIVELLAITADDPRSLGQPDAPVLMVEFTDFECPFCRGFVEQTRPELISRFVDQGVLRIVARDFPVSSAHPAALVAAVAARCAAAQGQFWPMYERLFATHGDLWGGFPDRDRALFVKLAAELGLDTSAFTACQADPTTEAAVLAEAASAARLNVSATPSFLLNGFLVVGDQGSAMFGRLIKDFAGQQ